MRPVNCRLAQRGFSGKLVFIGTCPALLVVFRSFPVSDLPPWRNWFHLCLQRRMLMEGVHVIVKCYLKRLRVSPGLSRTSSIRTRKNFRTAGSVESARVEKPAVVALRLASTFLPKSMLFHPYHCSSVVVPLFLERHFARKPSCR